MGRVGRINAQALRLAETLSKGVTASTDSHVGEIGRAFTLSRGDTFEEFFGRIAARESHICPADLTLPRLKDETSVRVRRLFDKASWQNDKDGLTMDTGNAILDGVTRPLHRAWNGTILPVDHAWWKTHFPPNGWRCRCTVRALDDSGQQSRPGALRSTQGDDADASLT
ncbi:MAG: hypothetical protein HGA24_04505, partial [Candidatus Aminicenantes bacterium]|nr:hypothetical protein [Candidatus Aminicenantes bacterium]